MTARRVWRFTGPAMLIAGSITTIISLSLGAAMPRWIMIGWVAITLVLALLLLAIAIGEDP